MLFFISFSTDINNYRISELVLKKLLGAVLESDVESKNTESSDLDILNVLDEASAKPDFDVETDIFMDVKSEKNQIRCKSRVLGWLPGEFFIIEGPRHDNKEIVAKPGETFVIRYIHDGMIYGFHSGLVRRVLAPNVLWFMSYPNIVETRSLRRHRRLSVLIPAAVTGIDDSKCQITNISMDGARLICPKSTELSSKESLILSFMLPDGNQIKELKTAVRNVEAEDEKEIVGVEFDADQKEFRESIAIFVESVEI